MFSDEPGVGAATGLVRRLAWIAALWTAHLTVYPLASTAPADAAMRVADGLSTFGAGRPAVHVVTFGLLGALVGIGWSRRSRSQGVLAIVAFAIALEILQGFAPLRHPRLSDLLLDLAAGGSFFAIARRVERHHRVLARFEPLAGRTARALGIVAAFVLGGALVLHERDVSFSTWDASFGIALGDELTGGRAWDGVLEGFAIHPEELDAAEVVELAQLPFDAHGLAERRARGAVLQRGADSPAGLALGAGTRFPPEDVARLYAALRDGSELSVELLARSADTAQRGPARLVTFSADPLARNFTVGQERDALAFRVRTPPNGENGLETVVVWPGVFDATAPSHHLVTTFARGRARAFRDGEALTPRVWRIDWRGARFPRIPIAQPLWAAVLFALPMATLLRSGWPETAAPVRWLVEGGAVGAIACAAPLLGVGLFATSWDPTLPVVLASAVPLFDAIGAAIARAVGTGR